MKSSTALGGPGFSMYSLIGRRPRSKQLEYPGPLYTEDPTVLAKGPGEGPGVAQGPCRGGRKP